MWKIDQKVVDKTKGTCMRAAVASIFELYNNQVPNFVEEEKPYHTLFKFFMDRGYDPSNLHLKNDDKRRISIKIAKEFLKNDGGVNGYFYATVPSQTYKGVQHAVVVDVNLNVVHDPNPNRRALELKPEDIIFVMTVNRKCYIDVDGNVKLF